MSTAPRRGKSSTRPSTQNSSNNQWAAKHKIMPQFTNNYAIRRKKLKSQIKEIMKECERVEYKVSQEIRNIEVFPDEEEYSEQFHQ